jgi:hypothetical protein
MRAGLAVACIVVGCGGGSSNGGDAGLLADDAPLVDAATSPDALLDGLPDALPDARPDAPAAPPSYVVVETALEVHADIGHTAYAQVHVKNTGGTPLSFSFAVTGEIKLKPEQRFASEGCVVPPGEECIGFVSFLPLVAGDRSAALTIHPLDAALADIVVPIVGRTYTLFSLNGFTGSVAGTITSSSPDVTCTGATCGGHFLDNLTLTATPMPGHVFVGWTEASCGSLPTCVVPRSTTARQLGASFAPILEGQLSVVMTGAPPGTTVNVLDESGLSQSVLGVCATNCTVPIPSEIGPTPTVRISVDSPRGMPAITGACAGGDRCSFTAVPSAAATISWTFDPKLPRTTVLDIGGLRAVARGANGDVFVSTLAQGNDAQWTVKLDANGNVLWAYPTTGQLIAQADGGVAISFPTYGLFAMQDIVVRDADGYLARREFNQVVSASPTNNIEVDHFARTLAMGVNAVFATPGTETTMSAIEAWGPLGSGIHWDATTAGDGARSITSDTAGVFYLASASASGVSATKFASTGASLGTVPGVAETVPLVMTVAAGGDIVSTTGTAGPTSSGGLGAEVILRRVSASGVQKFERRVLSPATEPNRAGVVVLANGEAMWLHGTRGQYGGTYFPTGIVAERVSPTGTVVWSFTQTTSAGGNIEVFDLGVAGGVPVAAGFYESLAFGARSWIATFAP